MTWKTTRGLHRQLKATTWHQIKGDKDYLYMRVHRWDQSRPGRQEDAKKNDRKGGSQSLKHVEESKYKKSEEQDKTKHEHDKSDFNQQYRRKKNHK